MTLRLQCYEGKCIADGDADMVVMGMVMMVRKFIKFLRITQWTFDCHI